MKRFTPMRRFFTLSFAVTVLALMLSVAHTLADTQAELDAAINKIDMKLYEQSEADIRAWLNARIAAADGFPVYPWNGNGRLGGDSAQLNLNRGALADSAAQIFRAYEMFGDKKYLEAGTEDG